MIRLFARRYGASPAHLAGHLALFALAFWAISTMLDMRAAGNWVLWLVAAAILHDLLLLPLYAIPDRALARVLSGRRAPRVPVINHVRVPVAVSAVLLLVSFPLVLERAPGNITRVAGVEPDGYLEEGSRVTFGDTTLEVLFVPGHAPGHIAFYHPGQQFCIGGDVLFQGGIGRYDLPGGNQQTLLGSIRGKLFPLGDDVTVHPGHGPTTTIGRERKYNPFLQS